MAAALALVGRAPAVRAQDSLDLQPPTAASIAGRVVTPAGEKVIPVPGVMVTLHRVGPDNAGPVDSVRSGADGRYAMRYTRSGNRQAIYFAAVVHRGIAYFSAPIQALRTPEEGDAGEIVVFDTTTHVMPYTIHGHHVVVGAPGPDGTRKIVEVYEISNDTSVTVVGRDSLSPVWTAALPRGATQFAGGEGDVSPAALATRGDTVMMLAPFGPGIKQLSYSYTLSPSRFPLELTLARYTGVLEVLLEEQGAQALGTSLRPQGDASSGGRTFKRFLGQGAPAGERLRIDVPVVAAGTRTRVLIGLGAVIALAMIASLARALARRGRGAGGTPPAQGATSESLLAAIAALDARHEAGDAALAADVYAAERAALKRSLVETLQRERGAA
jgi:hypothetical protein